MKSLIARCACGRGKPEIIDTYGFTIRCSHCRLMLGQGQFSIPLTEEDVIGMWNARAVDNPLTRDCKHCIGADSGECPSCAWGGFSEWDEIGVEGNHTTRITAYSGRWIDRLGKKCEEEELRNYNRRMEEYRKRLEYFATLKYSGMVRGILKLPDQEGKE